MVAVIQSQIQPLVRMNSTTISRTPSSPCALAGLQAFLGSISAMNSSFFNLFKVKFTIFILGVDSAIKN